MKRKEVDCVKDDNMRKKKVNAETTSSRDEWKLNPHCADLK